MHDVTTEAVEHRNQKVKRAAQIQVRNVDMPMLVRFFRLIEACAFLGRLDVFAVKPASCFENSIRRTGTYGDDVRVEHHERQSPVTFQRMAIVEVDDRLLLPGFEPPVARNLAVVLVGFAVPFAPRVVLAAAQLQPEQQLFHRCLGTIRPVLQVVDDCVARIVGNPASF